MGLMGTWCRMCTKMMGTVESMVGGMLPGMGAGGVGEMLMPAVRVDVAEDDCGIFVVADLPGVEKENITACLLSPTKLGIFSERRMEAPEAGEGTQVMWRERTSGKMKRMIPLPHEATVEGATASFTNGVLRIRLRRCEAERGERIPIE
jgi:HSP20 family protein